MTRRIKMARPNGAPPIGTDVLRERIFILDQEHKALRENVGEIARSMVTKDDLTGIVSSITELKTQWAEGNRPRTTMIIAGAALGLNILALIGAMAYMPIKTTSDTLANDVSLLKTSLVPRTEHQREWDRTLAAIDKLEKNVKENQSTKLDATLYREAHQNLQNQVDELRKKLDAISEPRDFLREIQRRLDKVEELWLKSRS